MEYIILYIIGFIITLFVAVRYTDADSEDCFGYSLLWVISIPFTIILFIVGGLYYGGTSCCEYLIDKFRKK